MMILFDYTYLFGNMKHEYWQSIWGWGRVHERSVEVSVGRRFEPGGRRRRWWPRPPPDGPARCKLNLKMASMSSGTYLHSLLIVRCGITYTREMFPDRGISLTRGWATVPTARNGGKCWCCAARGASVCLLRLCPITQALKSWADLS